DLPPFPTRRSSDLLPAPPRGLPGSRAPGPPDSPRSARAAARRGRSPARPDRRSPPRDAGGESGRRASRGCRLESHVPSWAYLSLDRLFTEQLDLQFAVGRHFADDGHDVLAHLLDAADRHRALAALDGFHLLGLAARHGAGHGL